MSEALRALTLAFRSLLQPQMLLLTIAPIFIAIFLWIGISWFWWADWSQWLTAMISSTRVSEWLAAHGLSSVPRYSAVVLLSALVLPMIVLTAALVAALIEMPIIVKFVATHDYPMLEKRRGGTLFGSIIHAITTVFIFCVLWITTLPLWLTGILAPVLTIVLGAYLNQRLFRYDALADHASADEYHVIVAASWRRMYLLGILLALLYAVPILNLTVPVLSGLAYTHFGLARLAALRAAST